MQNNVEKLSAAEKGTVIKRFFDINYNGAVTVIKYKDGRTFRGWFNNLADSAELEQEEIYRLVDQGKSAEYKADQDRSQAKHGNPIYTHKIEAEKVIDIRMIDPTTKGEVMIAGLYEFLAEANRKAANGGI